MTKQQRYIRNLSERVFGDPDFKRPEKDPFDPGLPSFLAMAERRFERYMAAGDFPLSKPVEKGSSWRLMEVRGDGAAYMSWDGLMVILSAAAELDGKYWLHVSASRKGKLPSYEDLCLVKKEFIGDNREAVQVFAKRAKHVNINPHVLHLWSRLEGSPLPDFSRGMGSI